MVAQSDHGLTGGAAAAYQTIKTTANANSNVNVNVNANASVNVSANVSANASANVTTCRYSLAKVANSGGAATSLLAHRPNILRAAGGAASKQSHVPNILAATAVKRPAASQIGQIAGLDCKHMVLTPSANNLSGIIGKMIVHQHDVTDSTDGPGANHLALDVPVNIQ